MISTSILWLLLLLAAGLIASNLVLLWMLSESQSKWMRIFSAQQGIPIHIMENRPEEKKADSKPSDNRKRMTIPVPMGSMPRPN